MQYKRLRLLIIKAFTTFIVTLEFYAATGERVFHRSGLPGDLQRDRL